MSTTIHGLQTYMYNIQYIYMSTQINIHTALELVLTLHIHDCTIYYYIDVYMYILSCII